MKTSSSKKNVEKIVLGLCLENRFAVAKRFLSEKNFSNDRPFSHQRIWQSMQKVFPLERVNIQSVWINLEQHSHSHYLDYLKQLSSHVFTGDLEAWSLKLLEMDIKEKINVCLSEEKRKAEKNEWIDQAMFYDQLCQRSLSDELDFFEMLQTLVESFEVHNGMDIPIQLKSLINSVDPKVEVINSARHIQALLEHLYRYAQSTGSRPFLELTEKLINTHKQNNYGKSEYY